ncbi:MAG: hypothetical protein L0Y72_29660 [Gemmataceae bacterium]|nr:hypothetical protein [Gemmataceae bacterium]MCI0743214.1 hypothetical protein [Gemmataceae bacterium]
MTFQGRVKNGVIVLTNGSSLAEGTLVNIVPAEEVPAPSNLSQGRQGPYPVSNEQREALLGLIGLWKMDQPPDDEEVERIIEEARMKKYG